MELTYEQAKQNLDTGGLQGTDLQNAQGVLAKKYAVDKAMANPTVLTNTGIIEDKIPKITSEAEKTLGGAPPGWDAATYANFKAANPGLEPTAEDTARMQNAGAADKPADPLGDYFKSTYDDIENDPTIGVEERMLNNLQASGDAATASYIDAIKKNFQADQEQLAYSQKANKAVTKNSLLRAGTARYAPTVAAGIMSAEARADVRTLSKLQAQENVQIGEAMQAKQNNDFQILEKRLAQIKDIRDQKRDLAKQMFDAMQKKQDQLNKDIGDVVKELGKNGAPAEIIAGVQNAGSLGEAVANAGDYLQSGPGTVGEYLYYKRDAIAHGQVPMSYNEYADMDANRKRSIVNINGGGLSSPEQTRFITITNKYQADPIITASLKANQIKQVADAIIADPNNTSNQLSSLYLFVKNLDPDSAVREGELSLANKTQSYQQQFGNQLTRLGKGQVLSPAAAKELAIATKALVSTWQETADRKTNLYKAQANNASPAIGQAFDGYLTDYNDYNAPADAVQKENDFKDKVVSYGTTNPKEQAHIRQLAGVVQPDLGRAYTWEEIAQILGL